MRNSSGSTQVQQAELRNKTYKAWKFPIPFDGHIRYYTGKMQRPLQDLLKEHDVAIGIFPCDATNYEFNEETKKLVVYIRRICEVGYKDSSVLRFNTTVTGVLEKGKLTDIDGMKTKVLIWVKVSAISPEASKLHFSTGMRKTRNRDAYEIYRDGIMVNRF